MTDAERLARLVADQQLVESVRREGFDGRTWRVLSPQLVAYGRVIMRSWILREKIFEVCADKGIDVSSPPEEGFSTADVDALTEDTLKFAITRFQNKVLADDKWDPRRGATLKSYFIGACLLQFPTTYKDWIRSRVKEEKRQASEREAFQITSDHQRPWRSGAVEQPFDEILEDAIPDVLNRDILRLRDEGLSQAEISKRMGITEGAIESRLHRLRKRWASKRVRPSAGKEDRVE